MTPWTVTRQTPLSMGLSQQEYWSGLPFPPPEELSEPGIEPMSPALTGGFFTTSTSWEVHAFGDFLPNKLLALYILVSQSAFWVE